MKRKAYRDAEEHLTRIEHLGGTVPENGGRMFVCGYDRGYQKALQEVLKLLSEGQTKYKGETFHHGLFLLYQDIEKLGEDEI